MKRSINHPVPPSACKFCQVVSTNFFVEFVLEGLDLLRNRRYNEIRHFSSLFYFIINTTTRRIIDFLSYKFCRQVWKYLSDFCKSLELLWIRPWIFMSVLRSALPTLAGAIGTKGFMILSCAGPFERRVSKL